MTTYINHPALKWLSKRILGLNYKTKLVMCYLALGAGFYLTLLGKDIVGFTALAIGVLGVYSAANVTEANSIRRRGDSTDTNEG